LRSREIFLHDRRAREFTASLKGDNIAVHRGGTLVSARVPDADRSRLDAMLDPSAVNLGERRTAWQKSGWAAHDPSAQPYSAEQVRKERSLY